MKKTVHCKCKTGCRTGHCVCYKKNEPCDEKCGFTGCHNPFNLNLLSDQAMFLYFIKKSVKKGRFSVLGNTFQGQKHAGSNTDLP